MTHAGGQGIAIIGMSGRFPGARDLAEFWTAMAAGRDGITRFSERELADAGVPRSLLDDPAYVPAAGMLDGPGEFDAEFFGFTPSEAELTDPQHRLFLECSWEGLESAGYVPGAIPDRVGVFASAATTAYRYERIARHPRAAEIGHPMQVSIGNDLDMLALRLSYKLDLTGPSVTVQTACSSSLVAVHLACQSLLLHECDMALAGGAAVRMLEPEGYLHEDGGILSRDGACRPFDAAASGTVAGDGVGVVVLKRLAEAVADGDHVHAVILGSAVNNDGAAKAGFTAPSPAGQTAVISEALAVADVSPATIQYVEAHGTATALGDPIEVRALADAFGTGPRPGPCLLGSVKSTIGHLDAAAGVAGLIRAVLAIEHRFVPPTPHLERPNPDLRLESSPFRVNAEGTPWPAGAHPPRAGVSSFGIGGTNVHVVLEAAPQPAPAPAPAREWQVLPLSARTPAALDAATSALAEHLRTDDPHVELADVARTLQTGRKQHAHRRAVVCRDTGGAVRALDTAPSAAHHGAPVQPAFMFPGQASQFPGMAADLYEREPRFREAMDECAELLRPHLGWDVREAAFGQDGHRLGQTLFTQPAVFSVDYALARMLGAWGVRPAAMIGHSLGELVAACLAGVFTLPDVLRIVAARARLMQDLPPGRMLSVALGEAEVAPLLDGLGTVAAVNAPGLCVVSGGIEEIAELRRRFERAGVPTRELDTSHAFHSAVVEPVLPELAEAVRSASLGTPKVPFASNVTGTWITPEQATDPEYWVSHTRLPVRFADGVAALLELGDLVLAEVGPGKALSGLVPAHTVPLLPRPRNAADGGVRNLLTGLADLWRQGVAIDWEALHEGEGRRRVPLPTYPFERRTYLLPRPENATPAKRPPSRWTYVPVWHQAPAPPRREPEAEPADWLIFEDGRGLAAGLAAALRGEGHRITAVRRSQAFARPAVDEFRVDPADADQLRRMVNDLRRDGRGPTRVLYAWSIAGEGPAPEPDRRFTGARDTCFAGLLHLAQALTAAGDSGPVRVDVLTDDLLDVTGDPVRLPERAMVFGAARVLSQEFPALTYRCVDVALPGAGPAPAELLDRLMDEVSRPREDDLAAYRGGRRWSRAFAPVGLEPVPAAAGLRPDACYLVTAAGDEGGLIFAEHLAAAGAKVVVLGHDDLTDAEQARDAVRKARAAAPGGLRGVIHAIGTRGSGMAALKTPEQFDPVLAARVGSTLLLDELVAEDDLDFFLVCSATTGLSGGFGQLDNSAVATFLDAFAHARAATGRAATAIDWAQWDWDDWHERQAAGMPRMRAEFERHRRDHGIPTAEGMAIAWSALAAGLPQVVVSTADLQDVLAGQPGAFMETLAASREPAGDGGWDPAAAWPDDEVARGVAAVWRDVLGASGFGPGDDFFDLGGNSLFAIQIVARLRQAYGDLPMSVVFEAPTVEGVAAAIRAQQAEDIGLDEFDALLKEVESLSPEEARARLRGDSA